MMPYTKAGGQAVNRYSKKAYDDVRLRVKKGQKEIIQKRAEELNKSVNSYIVDLIEEDLKRDQVEIWVWLVFCRYRKGHGIGTFNKADVGSRCG